MGKNPRRWRFRAWETAESGIGIMWGDVYDGVWLALGHWRIGFGSGGDA